MMHIWSNIRSKLHCIPVNDSLIYRNYCNNTIKKFNKRWLGMVRIFIAVIKRHGMDYMVPYIGYCLC